LTSVDLVQQAFHLLKLEDIGIITDYYLVMFDESNGRGKLELPLKG
jgi:hypothetical protein